jgi:hypothetical protein
MIPPGRPATLGRNCRDASRLRLFERAFERDDTRLRSITRWHVS